MTKTITIVTGSVRPNSAGDNILPLIQAELEKHDDVVVRIANLKQLNMPFVDSPVSPADETYEPTHDSVRQWQQLVRGSDGLVMLTPEYNAQLSAVQKNAIDWLFADWKDKPVAIVSYGWGGGALSSELLVKILTKVQAKPLESSTQLFFTKDISLDGTAVDQLVVSVKLSDTITDLLRAT